MDIIIKKGFERHWNRAFDKKPIWIDSKKQYDYEMKKRGMIPYDPDRQEAPKRKAYKVSEETREIAKAIKEQSDKKGNLNPSGKLMGELIKRKVVMKNSDLEKIKKRVSGKDGFSEA